MRLTGSRVRRGLVLLSPDEYGIEQLERVEATIALARCNRCGGRARILPSDVLPQKTYGLAVIERCVASYATGERSLRTVVDRLYGEPTPTHTTLRGWTEGLGAHALGRATGQLGGAPMSALMVEAETRTPALRQARHGCAEPDPRRYRSEPRRDRLRAVTLACALLRLIADAPHPHAMAACRRLLLAWSTMSALEFPSRLLDTAIEHPDGSLAPGSPTSSNRSHDSCQTRTRSPPDASSRSPS